MHDDLRTPREHRGGVQRGAVADQLQMLKLGRHVLAVTRVDCPDHHVATA